MKETEKLVSVIVAAYNIEKYISRCLESLIAQTYQNLEIIVVDDGSTDETGSLCDMYALRDSRIVVIHQENKGLSGARNAALAVAKGKYIGYVDGDDWIEPDMYGSMYLACERNNAQLAVCSYKQIGNDKEKQSFTQKEYVLTRDEALDIYLCDNKLYHIYNSVWSKLFRRELIKDVWFPEGKKSEDIMYTTKAIVGCEKCVFLDTPYYNYVMDRPESIMNQGLHQRRFEDEIPFWREQIAYLRASGMQMPAQKAMYYFYRRMLFYYIEFRDIKMKRSANELAIMLKGEKRQISKIYENSFVAKGDKVRMKVFLLSSGAYYGIVKLYDKFIIPLRQSQCREHVYNK